MHEMRERDVCWASDGARASRVTAEDVSAACAAVARSMVIQRFGSCAGTAGFKEDATLFAAVWWWWREGASHGC